MRLALLLLSFSIVQAQGIPQSLAASDAVAEQLSSADTEILLVAPSLRSLPIANALREAALRGVNVFILAEPTQVELQDSYVPGLDHPQLAQVGLISEDRTFAVLDTSVIIEGPLLSRESVAFDAPETFIIRDTATVQNRSSVFQALWERSVPYENFVDYISITLESE